MNSTSTIYYTGKGDDGTTGMLSGKRVRKDDSIIEAIGDIDELNSAIGIAISELQDEGLKSHLRLVQNALFVIGANLASGDQVKISKAQLDPNMIVQLETSIKEVGSALPDLNRFVLPGGSRAAAQLHMARSIARRCERDVIAAKTGNSIDQGIVAYLNRLSSYLFAAALYANYKAGVTEKNPSY